jgi:hypothetical protein
VGDVGAQHRELVAADAGHQIGVAHHRREAPADLAQHHVAHAVAEAVVDRLEPVEVDVEHPDVRSAGGVVEGVLEALEEHGPVGQTREGVVAGRVAQRRGRALALEHQRAEPDQAVERHPTGVVGHLVEPAPQHEAPRRAIPRRGASGARV